MAHRSERQRLKRRPGSSVQRREVIALRGHPR
jgi:hypothetical protein